MRFAALLLPCVLLACSSSDRVTDFSVGDTAYRVPSAHVRSLSREPHRFVRIKPPEHSFELIYDSRTSGRTDAQGWPIIFSLNDEPAPDIDRHASGTMKIVCRREVNPRGGCGLGIAQGGAQWAVFFPNAQLGEAPAIRRRALAALQAYRA